MYAPANVPRTVQTVKNNAQLFVYMVHVTMNATSNVIHVPIYVSVSVSTSNAHVYVVNSVAVNLAISHVKRSYRANINVWEYVVKHAQKYAEYVTKIHSTIKCL